MTQFRRVYDEYWGRACGRELNGRGYCCSTVDVRLQQSQPLVVRKDYAKAYRYLADAAAKKEKRALVWYGQPGTGKSLGLRHNLLQAVEDCQPVVFWAGNPQAVAVMANEGIFAIPLASWRQPDFLVYPIVLLDSPRQGEVPPMLYEPHDWPVGLASSPQLPRFQDFAKVRTADFLVGDVFRSAEFDDLLILTADLSTGNAKPTTVPLASIKPRYTATSATAATTELAPEQAPSTSVSNDDVTVPPDDIVMSDNSALTHGMHADPAEASLAHLPLTTQEYWLKWARDKNCYTPIEAFRLAGPSVRDPLNGVRRLTGIPRIDFFGDEFVKAPVNALADLYRLLSPKMNADPNAPQKIELRSEY
ncbi:hypothetical protein JCM10296v2_005704 [Rhodotorula toruloides]